MRPFEIFASMSADEATRFFAGLAEKQPDMLKQAAAAAAAALKSRPSWVMKLPPEKQAQTIRRALSRIASNPAAEEILAVYFLECRTELLEEWLDLVGVEHEKGVLQGDEPPAAPEDSKLDAALESFRSKGDDPDRTLLLQAFAAQGSIDWPRLDEALKAEPAANATRARLPKQPSPLRTNRTAAAVRSGDQPARRCAMSFISSPMLSGTM